MTMLPGSLQARSLSLPCSQVGYRAWIYRYFVYFFDFSEKDISKQEKNIHFKFWSHPQSLSGFYSQIQSYVSY